MAVIPEAARLLHFPAAPVGGVPGQLPVPDRARTRLMSQVCKTGYARQGGRLVWPCARLAPGRGELTEGRQMKRYRLAALALTACAAILSVTACTAGTTTSSHAPSRSAASSTTTSPSATTPTPIPASSVSVAGPIGSFPIPAGAKVAENAGLNRGTLVVITSGTAAKALNFYESILPQARYTITRNTSS